MSFDPDRLPDDIDALKALVLEQASAHQALAEDHEEQSRKLARYRTQIDALHEQIRLLLARRFGAASEKLPDGQLGLFNEAEAACEEDDDPSAVTVEVPAHRRRPRRPRGLPPELPRIEIEHDLDPAEKVCPHDGTALQRIGEESSEQLDIVPAQVRVLRHVRHKYACPCCRQHVRTAPLVPQPIPKSQASPGLLAYVAVSKYADALPLYRQTKLFARIGVELPRSTLASWMVRSGQLLQPVINLLREAMLAGAYIQCDETTVQVLKEPGKAAQSRSYLWCQRSGDPARPMVLFDYDPTRSGEVPRRLLGEFSGVLQTDGYEGYHAVVRDNGITHLYCFAHARRRFVDALKALGLNPKKLPDKPPEKARKTLKGLGFIRTLYAIEKRLRGKPPDERHRVRQQESLPVLERLRSWLTATRPQVAPKTTLGQALGYLDAHWDGLIRYCNDGRLEIDNNLCENAIRPFVVGRRNWLFSDTVHGAKASANLYSLIETAKVNGLEPYAYLRHVFAELPKAETVEHIEALLPYQLDKAVLNTHPA